VSERAREATVFAAASFYVELLMEILIKNKTKTNRLTSHDPVFGPEQFDDLADSDGTVNVFHDIV
jgi:hypothetical protein